MSRRRWLWTLGVASFALFAVLAALDARMVEEGGWGIVDFELAGSRGEAERMLAAWGPDGRDAARLSLWLDFLYLAAYGAFGALAVAAVRDLAHRRGWRTFAAFGALAVPFPLAAAGADALENVHLLLVLGDRGGAWAPPVAMAFALVKFALLATTYAYLLAGLVRAGWARRRALTGALLALVALLVVVTLAVGVPATGETKAALEGAPDARDGRVVRLAGGDLYLEDTGQRGDAAIVLIHGYTGSTRWWSRIAPGLAERHRVVNVDLLGHGRSEKPRQGYEMEEQADLVLGALRRLGVRRAVVVGHSMGGWVAIAMAERDPRAVRGVATIGTPADAPEGEGAPSDRLGYVPVLGGAIWKGLPRGYVRSEMESGFAGDAEVPDHFVDDTLALTWRAFARSARAGREFREERAPYLRIGDVGTPLLAIVGEDDERVRDEASREWDRVARGRVLRMPGVGHSAQWERPRATLLELDAFAGPLLR